MIWGNMIGRIGFDEAGRIHNLVGFGKVPQQEHGARRNDSNDGAKANIFQLVERGDRRPSQPCWLKGLT